MIARWARGRREPDVQMSIDHPDHERALQRPLRAAGPAEDIESGEHLPALERHVEDPVADTRGAELREMQRDQVVPSRTSKRYGFRRRETMGHGHNKTDGLEAQAVPA
jgi:hypothetical protein